MPMPSKWRDTMYVTAYEAARGGMNNTAIAKTLGVTPNVLLKWISQKPALANALERARGANGKSTASQFHEYVFNRLPDDLKDLFSELLECENEPNSVLRTEALLKGKGKRTRQHLFCHALVASAFNISRACSLINITAGVYRHWISHDLGFREIMDEIHWHKKNFFEGALVSLVARGDAAATIFANRTQNADRGYNEKLNVEHSGTVNVNHKFIPVDSLNLPLETRKVLLTALRANKEQQLVLSAPEAPNNDDDED